MKEKNAYHHWIEGIFTKKIETVPSSPRSSYYNKYSSEVILLLWLILLMRLILMNIHGLNDGGFLFHHNVIAAVSSSFSMIAVSSSSTSMLEVSSSSSPSSGSTSCWNRDTHHFFVRDHASTSRTDAFLHAVVRKVDGTSQVKVVRAVGAAWYWCKRWRGRRACRGCCGALGTVYTAHVALERA